MFVQNLTIENVKCHGCVNSIQNSLNKIQGIDQVIINPATGTLKIISNQEIDIEIVVRKLNKLGYPVAGQRNSLPLKVKSYVSCMIGRVN